MGEVRKTLIKQQRLSTRFRLPVSPTLPYDMATIKVYPIANGRLLDKGKANMTDQAQYKVFVNVHKGTIVSYAVHRIDGQEESEIVSGYTEACSRRGSLKGSFEMVEAAILGDLAYGNDPTKGG